MNRRKAMEHELAIRPGMKLREAEQMLIEATLASVDGNKPLAAKHLGISLQTLYIRLNKYAAVRAAFATAAAAAKGAKA